MLEKYIHNEAGIRIIVKQSKATAVNIIKHTLLDFNYDRF